MPALEIVEHILTMNLASTAVRTNLLAGHSRPPSNVLFVLRIPNDELCSSRDVWTSHLALAQRGYCRLSSSAVTAANACRL
jgi:hypothetical protein